MPRCVLESDNVKGLSLEYFKVYSKPLKSHEYCEYTTLFIHIILQHHINIITYASSLCYTQVYIL